METLMVGLKRKPFHGRQLHAWIHRHGATSFDEMTDLAKDLRVELADRWTIGLPKIVEQVTGEGQDSATKFLFELADGERVEAVYIPADDRVTVCLSSQVGCAFGCTFCATGLLGLKRNMTSAEIVGTFLAIRAWAPKRISNVVFMGMGEPLANLKEVMASFDVLTDPDGIGLSHRKVTLSTVGLPAKIRELADYPYPPKLVFSIASPRDEQRKRVLPVAGRFSLSEMHDALSDYAEKTKHWITIALLVADGLNDSLEDARMLHKWIGNLPAKVNLLRYNEAAGNFRRADEEAMERFAAELARLGRTVVLRRSRGRDISAACGQLAARSLNIEGVKK
ncbi:23S rRNA (adenine(2503)-C(2))-methyltransferase RlmN [bacterium]|nr:23S rRNA (adenine(2503)-C(2))-methyltransferase RlmN [bacterium]